MHSKAGLVGDSMVHMHSWRCYMATPGDRGMHGQEDMAGEDRSVRRKGSVLHRASLVLVGGIHAQVGPNS